MFEAKKTRILKTSVLLYIVLLNLLLLTISNNVSRAKNNSNLNIQTSTSNSPMYIQEWKSFWGGDGYEWSWETEVDSLDNVYITGDMDSFGDSYNGYP